MKGKFDTYSTYGASGVQFTAPGGYRCRLARNSRGNFSYGQCWGKLPGTSHTSASLSDSGDLTFGDGDPARNDQYQWIDSKSWHQGTFGPEAYPLLPAGSKIVLRYGEPAWQVGVCAVEVDSTACLVNRTYDAGQRPDSWFVLSPAGSHGV